MGNQARLESTSEQLSHIFEVTTERACLSLVLVMNSSTSLEYDRKDRHWSRFNTLALQDLDYESTKEVAEAYTPLSAAWQAPHVLFGFSFFLSNGTAEFYFILFILILLFFTAATVSTSHQIIAFFQRFHYFFLALRKIERTIPLFLHFHLISLHNVY